MSPSYSMDGWTIYDTAKSGASSPFGRKMGDVDVLIDVIQPDTVQIQLSEFNGASVLAMVPAHIFAAVLKQMGYNVEKKR